MLPADPPAGSGESGEEEAAGVTGSASGDEPADAEENSVASSGVEPGPATATTKEPAPTC